MIYFLDLPIAVNMLTHHYTRKNSVLEYDWPTCCIKHYTPLTLFCYKQKYCKSEAITIAGMLTLTGTMTHRHHSNVYGKITENISDLFTPFEKFTGFPDVILIEGAAGIGKTTLCKEIALQWTNRNILKTKCFLFLLLMCDPQIIDLSSIELLVNYFYKNKIFASKMANWLIATDGKYLTIIIDGYSEDCGNKFISDDIIGRKILTQCNLVITTRSPASSCLSKIANQRALILGFTKSNQINFIDIALKHSYSKNDNLKNYLQSNPIIDNLCSIPLIMNMLLWFIEEEMDSLPKLQTSLVLKYIMIITKRKNITSLIDLPQPYYQVIKDLSLFAFIAIQDHLTFTEDEILKLCENCFGFLNIIYALGLFNKTSFEAQNMSCELFHFSHVKIQEYLAAYYISSLSDSELLELLYGKFWNIRYFNVWIMYIGITKGNNSAFNYYLSGSQIFETSPSSKYIYCVNQLHCLKEADGNLNNTLLGQDIVLRHQKLSHDNLYEFTVLLSRSTNKEWKNLDLSNCSIDCHGCAIIFEILYSCTELSFEAVDISDNNFHWESFYTFCGMLKIWQTKSLTFSVDALYDTITMTMINNFTAKLKKCLHKDTSSDEVLLLTYLPKHNCCVFSTELYQMVSMD